MLFAILAHCRNVQDYAIIVRNTQKSSRNVLNNCSISLFAARYLLELDARLAVLSVHESFPPKVSLDEALCQYSQQFYPFLDESTLHEFFLRKTVFLLEQKEHSTGLQKIQCTK